ncbi:hypothetical protein LPB140_01180 [Sphingorhabdus lutea]|uniref:Polysaccharide export protein N-terminal domain-containing protein n=1 Tax=Sphingorhabdus lutea TaxID=1913578 RepID=A0A1L3J963_9SPHN|nr:polysaccharide biosynthesis/export family protein [Sphingorhabdus lutea]APG61676.1 hypothetical protein LPB140_01180 [Sphingorhabdus lutea]
MKQDQIYTYIAMICGLFSLSGCVTVQKPHNPVGAYWMPEQIDPVHDDRYDVEYANRANLTCHKKIFQPSDLGLTGAEDRSIISATPILGSGDQLAVRILGDKDRLSNIYVINADGNLYLPGLPPINIAGQNVMAAERTITNFMVAQGMARPLSSIVQLILVEHGSINVQMSGAVFSPGNRRVAERSAESKAASSLRMAIGDFNGMRTVAPALQAAGGVRPDANISQIYIVRNNKWAVVDMSAVLSGGNVPDIALADGDRIIVPSRNCADKDLIRPSAITAPGIRIFISNLTRSANNNAGAAIGKESTSLPYGTTMMDALVSGNCVGGSAMASDRWAVLVSRNPINGQSIVIRRRIEDLIHRADRDFVTPYLMPNDSVACYDSGMTNFREILGMMTDTVTPAIILSKVAQ